MSDPRETASNGRVSHVSLRGAVDAKSFTEGTAQQVSVPIADLLRSPGGPRDRQLVKGEGFRLLDDPGGPESEPAFGFAERDGYCGYVLRRHLAKPVEATHVVRVRQTYEKETADLKTWERTVDIPFGSRLRVVGRAGAWSRIAFHEAGTGTLVHRFVPSVHLRPVGAPEADPADVARRFLGTPYLWGGNSGLGIDCSGLVQAAMLACGIVCPGDSDQQAARLGTALPGDAPLRRGDVVFWPGHVGILTDAETLIHANAHHMAVAEEPLADAVDRIAGNEGKGVTVRRRVTPPRG